MKIPGQKSWKIARLPSHCCPIAKLPGLQHRSSARDGSNIYRYISRCLDTFVTGFLAHSSIRYAPVWASAHADPPQIESAWNPSLPLIPYGGTLLVESAHLGEFAPHQRAPSCGSLTYFIGSKFGMAQVSAPFMQSRLCLFLQVT